MSESQAKAEKKTAKLQLLCCEQATTNRVKKATANDGGKANRAESKRAIGELSEVRGVATGSEHDLTAKWAF